MSLILRCRTFVDSESADPCFYAVGRPVLVRLVYELARKTDKAEVIAYRVTEHPELLIFERGTRNRKTGEVIDPKGDLLVAQFKSKTESVNFKDYVKKQILIDQDSVSREILFGFELIDTRLKVYLAHFKDGDAQEIDIQLGSASDELYWPMYDENLSPTGETIYKLVSDRIELDVHHLYYSAETPCPNSSI